MKPININLGNECDKCGSPFHTASDCTSVTPKFQFKSRKQLGLNPGELPFKFRVEIDPNTDDEVEVARKKALLRLNSSRVYTQMGYAVKAQEAGVELRKYLTYILDNSDEEEQSVLKPLLKGLDILQAELMKLRQSKISQAVKMEEIANEAHKQARKVRLHTKKKSSKKLKKDGEFYVFSLPGNNGEAEINIPVTAETDNPFEVFDDIKQSILRKERNKKREYPSEQE